MDCDYETSSEDSDSDSEDNSMSDKDSESNSESDCDSEDNSKSDSDSEDNSESDCDPEKNSESTVKHQKKKNLVRSQYYDVMVKVDADVYCLNKLRLAWKSDYFEKLFIEYSDRKECSLIELPVMDTNTFSAIVDIIYGKTLSSVLNHNNYITLLMALDYFQMQINLKAYARFIKTNLTPDTKIFRLYNFIRENPNLHCLLPSVLKYLSVHLSTIKTTDDFLSLPFEYIVQIVLGGKNYNEEAKMLKISQMCSKWICYDLQNRLPHVAKLVNAAKRRFNYLNEIMDEDFNSMLSNTTGQVDVEMMTKIFYKFLVCDGEMDLARQKLLQDENNPVSMPSSNKENKRKKLTKLLENGYFHDIVVIVGEKTYKLHRFKLNRASGYFAEIASTKQSNADAQCTEAAPTQQQQPNINEYVIRDVDQTTFDIIIKYIYFRGELPLTTETVTRVLRAANILKMRKLFDRCLRWMQNNIERTCAEVLIIDECISRSWIRSNIKEIFSKILTEPEIDNTMLIFSISFDMLESLLLSSSHCCDNPHKIVDMCSKWIMHDVENRYHLVPQIALAINRNRNHYEMDASTSTCLNNCTEESIRDELWKILHSTVLVPPTEKKPENSRKRRRKKLHETPVFVALTWEKSTIHVLNADLEQIASLSVSNSEKSGDSNYLCVAATLVDDNLFIALSLDQRCFVFHVYNLSLKKFVSLNRYVAVKNASSFTKFWLLNCCGQVYCCFEQGHVLKYSTELNRWMMFSKKPVFPDKIPKHSERVWFTSYDDKLYRLYAEAVSEVRYPRVNLKYAVDEFNFEQNVWLSLSDMSFIRDCYEIQNFTILDDGKFIVMGRLNFMSFKFDRRRNSRMWREFSLPNNIILYDGFKKCYDLIRYEGKLLHVFGNKLYHWSQRNGTWDLKKELPSRVESVPSNRRKILGPYKCVSAIHKHNVGTVTV